MLSIFKFYEYDFEYFRRFLQIESFIIFMFSTSILQAELDMFSCWLKWSLSSYDPRDVCVCVWQQFLFNHILLKTIENKVSFNKSFVTFSYFQTSERIYVFRMCKIYVHVHVWAFQPSLVIVKKKIHVDAALKFKKTLFFITTVLMLRM